MPNKIIIVSNRLPVRVSKSNNAISIQPSIGGLATGLKHIHEKNPCIWIGWPGISLEEVSWSERRYIEENLAERSLYPVFLSSEDIENYYYGFCNSTIWPLFHYFPEKARFEERFWHAYQRVNELYLNAVLEVYRDGDIIWVHDYHLMLLPLLLRQKLGNDAPIGFFLHIPFPSSEVFKLMPWRLEILRGILGADLVGFHTYGYVRHFLSAVRRLLGFENKLGRIFIEDRVVLVDAFPMGIDFESFVSLLSDNEVRRKIEEYKLSFQGLKVILSVDRLDYTKGIPQRLLAYERFLSKYPEYIGKVVLVLLVSPSRIGVKEYAELKRCIDELVGRINGRFSTLDWSPILYVYKFTPLQDLLALYVVSDVALITPLYDGMNLVSKEYVAAKEGGDGVLILSEGAGASSELVEALIVNPNNIEEVADTIKRALEMSTSEKFKRMNAMRERIRRYNVYRWADDFMDRLRDVKREQQKLRARVITPEVATRIVSDFARSSSRLLLLDYDGTLVPLAESPDRASPDPELLSLLARLSAIENTEVVIISGRDRESLDRWFGDIDINLVAEHGAWIKMRGKSWEPIEPLRKEWKKEIRRILEVYVDRTPGSFIEEKEYSIAWHYRKVQAELGEVRAKELKDILLSLVASHKLEVLEGDKVIEIRIAGIGKGKAALKFLRMRSWSFILAAGDDWTDEEMFAVLPPEAYTIRIGLTSSRARYNIPNYVELRKILQGMGFETRAHTHGASS